MQSHVGRTVLPYFVALLAVGCALGLRVLLAPYTGIGAPYVMFFAAVLVTSLYAGTGPGLLAALLSAPLGAYVFVVRADYPISQASTQAALFLVDGVVVVYLTHLIRSARHTAEVSEQKLLAANRNKDEFLALLSHELRNPLAAIRNSATVLVHTTPDPVALRALRVIDRQTTQLARLVDDLLDVARIARGKIQLRHERVDLGELVHRTIEDERTSFVSRGIELEAQVGSERVWVDGDAARLTQVLGNLLHNAAKFTPRGGRVEVTLAREDECARLCVRDTGGGIAPEQLSRVLDPFVQVGTSAGSGGLGLGLALVKGIAELHGGSVEVASGGLGRGTDVSVRVPLAAAGPASLEVPTPRPTPRSRRVLVIEDSPDVADALGAVLELLHQDVRVARDGSSGIQLAREFHPDVVLCDIGLPGLDGYEVARRIREDPSLGGARLVALTGHSQPSDRERAVAAGFAQHLAKPATIVDLERVLDLAGGG